MTGGTRNGGYTHHRNDQKNHQRNNRKENRKRVVLILSNRRDENEIKKFLGGKFEVLELKALTKEKFHGAILVDYDMLTYGRADFVSKANRMLRSSKKKSFILLNILVRHFDTLISHIGPEVQFKAGVLILTKLLEMFRKDISDGRRILVGVSSDRKYIVLKEVGDTEESEGSCTSHTRLAKDVIEKITSEKIKIDGKEIHISVNVGVSSYPNDGENIAEILKAAELALEESIKKGTNIAEIFSDSLKDVLRRKSFLIEEILEGIKTGKIYPVFQPIFSVEEMRIKGYEMLLRWKKLDINPEEVIRISEEVGVIREVNEFLFERLSEVSRKSSRYFFSFNVAPRFVSEDRFMSMILESIKKYDVDPGRICFEISEKSEPKELESAKRNFQEIKKLGFLIALDDFGSPHTTIAHIKNVPADMIKVDREVIREIRDGDEFFSIIARGIIQAFHRSGKKVLVEGVETDTEFKIARSMNVDMVQGFFLSPPLSEEEIMI